MANIGNLALKLTADAGGFNSALDAAAAKANAFGKQVSAAIQGPFNAIGKAVNLPGSFLTPVLDGVKGLLTSIPFVGGAFAAIPTSAGGFLAWLKSSGDEMRAIAKQSKELGIDTTVFSALVAKAGGDAEGFVQSLRHLSRELGGLASGDAAAKRKFDDIFGVGGAKSFEGAGLEEAIRRISERMGQLPDQAQKAALAAELFGKDSKAALDIFGEGAGKVDEIIEKMKQKGIAFSAEDVQGFVDANKAVKEIEGTLTGVGRQLAIAIAPYVKELAEGFAGWLKGIDVKATILGVVDAIGRVVETVVNGIVDMYNKASLVLQLAAQFGQKNISVGGFLSKIHYTPRGEAPAFVGPPKPPDEGNGLDKTREAAEKMRQDVANVLKDPVQADTIFEKFEKQKNALETLAKAGGDTADAMKKLADSFRSAKEALAESLFKQAASEGEKFGSRLEEIKRLQDESLITDDVAASGAARVFEQLKSSLPGGLPGQIAAPQALEAGSAAELSFQNKFERQGLAGGVQEQIRELLRAAETQRQKQIEIGEQILAATKDDAGDFGSEDLD